MKHLQRLLLSTMLILVSTIMYAQTEITGTVVDGTGEPIIGATVMEKGTSNGAITDLDGNFKLKVGNYVANVKNETKGFRESVEKYYKGEDLEVLLPRITRE